MKTISLAITTTLLWCLSTHSLAFDFGKFLKEAQDAIEELEKKEANKPITQQLVSGLDTNTIVKGLKQALEKGTKQAVDRAGVLDGYFKNPRIKIPLPKEAERLSKTLRNFGLGRYADDLEVSFNRAAEKAAPLATDYFLGALKSMTFDDARKILDGGDDSATQFFRTKTSEKLTSAFRPVIDNSLADVGAVKLYRDLRRSVEPFGLASAFRFDVADYVTDKALGGLFTLVAEEEKRIRENPAARTTELLKEVFK